ncbi:MAG: tyrosine-type recombinase/integrase [Chloroflexota bacterium]|nr:tyrosine-type recombinase/integrase [Chloroflexota bacterium]
MKLSEAIGELLVATEADGRSPRTVADYEQKLALLVDFMGDRGLEEIVVGDLRRFVAYLRGREGRYVGHPNRDQIEGGLSIASVAGYVRAVKRLFNFLYEEEIIEANPARKLRTPKPGRGEPKAITADDFVRLLDATEGDSLVNRRDRALVLFLADTGCRVGGVVNLKTSEVDITKQVARVTEKGNHTRVVPFSRTTGRALAAWLEVRPAVAYDHVFINLGNRGGAALTTNGVRQVLRRLKRRSGAKGPVNPHSFRHGFAREYLLNGGDLASLADLLGHRDVKTTWASYAIFRMDELCVKHGRHSPVAVMGRRGDLVEDSGPSPGYCR